jgi:hypothetical protein
VAVTELQDLVEQLCIAAGAIMEDAADVAVLRGELGLAARVERIAAAGHDITALTSAAQVLLDQDRNESLDPR